MENENTPKKIFEIVVVEDLESEYEYIRPLLAKYFSSIDREYKLSWYKDKDSLLSNYKVNTDIVFMDIELGSDSGMEAANEIRRIDPEVIIVFCTKMAQFAVEGYQVSALDFIVKPYEYEKLAFVLNRAIRIIDKEKKTIIVKTKEGVQNILLDDILYIDVYGHSLGIHTSSSTLYSWGTLGKYVELLKGQGFLRCSNSCLVNVRHIKSVHGKEITIDNNDKIAISRPRHKDFMQSLVQWTGVRYK